MRIILSPAKKMAVNNDDFQYEQLPTYLKQAEKLYRLLQESSFAELKAIWNCSDKLVKENMEHLSQFSLRKNLSPALFTYVGLAYQHLSADAMTTTQLDYLREHLRILSGMYGVLKPFDGIVPYRLEMQAKIGEDDLYTYWGKQIYQEVTKGDPDILNLASKEYSQSIEPYITTNNRFVTCVFGELVKGKVVQKGTLAKMARGEMVYWLSEQEITDFEGVKAFAWNYLYSETYSTENEYVFLKQ